jgi:outer membrane receptor for ferrienterochelin and colicins
MNYIILVIVFLFNLNRNINDEPAKSTPASITISGRVESMGEQVPFATVFLKGTSMGVSSDANGDFRMQNVPPGECTIVFSAVGYKPVQRNISVEPGKNLVMTVELEIDNIGLEQVVISANRNAKSRREVTSIVNSINPKLFDRMQSVTLSEGLNFAPGIRMENNCQNCGFSQVRMNGLEGPYSQILINSRPVFSGLAGVYGLELIPVNMIERVEVIRGGGSAMYGGNAIAGTINLITKDPISNTFSVLSSCGATAYGKGSGAPDYNLNFNGSFVSEDNRSGLSFYGFHRKRDPFDANQDGFSELSSIENTTMGARIFQRTGNRGKISFDYFNIHEFRRGGNLFDLPLHESDIAESTTHKINSGSLAFDQLFRDSDKFSVWLSGVAVDRGSYYGANQDLSAYGQTDDISVSSGAQYLRAFSRLLFSPGTLTTGAEWNYNRLEDKKLGYYDTVSGTHTGNTGVADQQISGSSAFLQSEWMINPVVVTAGLRFDRYVIDDLLWKTETVTGNVLSPRLSLLLNLNRNLQFRTAFARGFRAPQIFDEDLHIETSGARQVLHRNDENLKQETSNSYTASLSYSKEALNWQYQLLAEGFVTRLNNPFANEYGEPDENGVVVYTRMNAEAGATVQGVNFEFNASPSRRIQFQSGFTIQRSRYEEPQEFGEQRFFRSPSRYGYLSLTYDPRSPFTFSVSGNYTGTMLVPYFGSRSANPDEGILVNTRSFFDAGIKVSYDIRVTQAIKLQVNTGLKNIFNAYQEDFDIGINRDPAYIYGPTLPRSFYFGLKFGGF